MITYIFLFILSFVVRLIKLDQSLWLDEGASVMFSHLPSDQFWQSLRGDFHPPLYYLVLRFINLYFGDNLIYLRLFSVLVGSLTVVVFASLLKLIFINTSLGRGKFRLPLFLSGGLLLSLNPLHIYYSQEIRMYALSALFSVLSWRLLLRPNNAKLFGHFLVNLLGIFTFYPLIFNLISQIVYLIFVDRQSLPKVIWYSFISLFIFLPWLPIFLDQLRGGGYLASVLSGWGNLSGIVSLKSLILIAIKFQIGRISLYPKPFYEAVSVLLILFQFFILFLSIRRPSLPLWFFLVIPIFLATLISLRSPMLGYWRFIFVLPPLLGLMVYGLQLLPLDLGVTNLMFLVVIYLFSLVTYFSNPAFQREDWRGLSKSLPEDGVLLVSFPEAFAPLKYYLPGSAVVPLQFSVGRNRTDWDIYLPRTLDRASTIWVSDYLISLTNPSREIFDWLEGHNYTLLGQKTFNGLGSVYRYQKP